MFKKPAGIEPLDLIPSAEKQLHNFADEVILYRDISGSAQEITACIGDADDLAAMMRPAIDTLPVCTLQPWP